MKERTTDFRVLARRVVHVLPVPLANVLRDAKRAALNLRPRREVFLWYAQDHS